MDGPKDEEGQILDTEFYPVRATRCTFYSSTLRFMFCYVPIYCFVTKIV